MRVVLGPKAARRNYYSTPCIAFGSSAATLDKSSEGRGSDARVSEAELPVYLRYYMSDHRILWAIFDSLTMEQGMNG